MNMRPILKRAAVREGECVEIDGQAYEVVDVDPDSGEFVVNVADARGRSLMLGHMTFTFDEDGPTLH